MAQHGKTSLRMKKRKIMSNYFDFINDLAKCKICNHTLKSNRLFNLKVHLRKLHNVTEDMVNGKFKSQYGVDSSKTKIKKEAIKVEICEQELIRSYIGLVIDDGLPFEFLDSENFAVFIDPLCQGLKAKNENQFLLNSTRCKRVLKLVADNVRDNIKSDVYQRLLSAKVNSAKGLPSNHFAISIQFIKKGEIINHMLGLVELKGSDASDFRIFATDISNLLASYDISLSQIVSITSDNNGDIFKASEDFSHCGVFDEEFVEESMDEGKALYLKKIQNFSNAAVTDLHEIQVTRCLSAVAQLCVLDVVKNPEIITNIFSCRNLVKFLQNPSNGYEDIFDQQNLIMPQLDCPSKWGSTYSMIECLIYVKNVVVKIKPVKDKSIDENVIPNKNFWDFLDAFCIAFEPLQQAINKFQEENLHYGNFYVVWLKCKLCTEKMLQTCSNKQVENILKMLLQSIENRTNELLGNESFLACLFLDPRFNHTLTLAKKLQALDYLKKMYERIKHITAPTVQIKTEEISIDSSGSQMETEEFSEKADAYLNEYLTRSFTTKPTEGMDIALKLENLIIPFCGVNSNILQFWMEKQLSDPEVYALSNVCFAFPANQISMEQTFSSLKNVVEDVRNNRDIVENILLVKQSPTHLDQAVENLPLFEEEDEMPK